MVYNWTDYTQNLLFPPRCICCGDKGLNGLALCVACTAGLSWNRHPCSCCARPLPATATKNSLCGQCQQHTPPFYRIHAPLLYRPPVTHLIKQLKFNRQLPVGRLLGTLLTDHLIQQNEALPELLLPVPLHRKRLRERGFNQAAEITRQIARQLHIPWSVGRLRKTAETPDQIGLNHKQRMTNLRGCFRFNNDYYQHVAIVDDVVTTGATVSEIARVLKKSGVKRVDILAVARTP